MALTIISLALVAIALWAVANPFDAVSLGWRFLSWLFSAFTKRYAKAAAERDVNAFFGTNEFKVVSETPPPLIRVDFVDTPEDPKLHEAGHLIVRIRHERDQARNILAVARQAVRQFLHPFARPYLEKSLVSAIDVQVLRLLAETLGRTAKHMFRVDILGMATADEPKVVDLLRLTHAIEQKGLFGHVLLQEFAYLSDSLAGRPPAPGLFEEAELFVNWLHTLATRPTGDESGNLLFVGREFRVAFILAAKTLTAAKGTAPYERRLGLDLAQGARSIYLLALTRAQNRLCDQITLKFSDDDRVSLVRSSTVRITSHEGSIQGVRISHFRRNELRMPDLSFPDQLALQGIEPGKSCEAQVRGFVHDKADLRIGTLEATLQSRDVGWGYRGDITRWAHSGETISVVVVGADEPGEHVRVILPLKALTTPSALPKPRERVVATVDHVHDSHVIVRIESANKAGYTFGRVPISEWSWLPPDDPNYAGPVEDTQVELEVAVSSAAREELILLRNALEVRDWPAALRKYPAGAQARGRVMQVSSEGIVVELEPGVYGRIAAFRLRARGFELRDFETSVVPGAYYDVVVLGVKERRKDFRLDLARK